MTNSILRQLKEIGLKKNEAEIYLFLLQNNISGQKIKALTTGLYSVKFLPEKCGENLTDILIWGDNIALIALEEPIFGTVIKSKPLSHTFRTLLTVIRDFV